jgi:hypothetical protein
VDDSSFASVLKRFADLRNDPQRLFGFQSSVAKSPAKVGPVDKLHEEIRDLAALAEVVNADDAGMAEFGEGPRFAREEISRPLWTATRRSRISGQGAE